MRLTYIDMQSKKQLEDDKQLLNKFPSKIVKKFKCVKQKFLKIDNLYNFKIAFRGLNVEKLRGNENKWSLRLNIKYRLTFRGIGHPQNIEEISLIKIHPHKYD